MLVQNKKEVNKKTVGLPPRKKIVYNQSLCRIITCKVKKKKHCPAYSSLLQQH